MSKVLISNLISLNDQLFLQGMNLIESLEPSSFTAYLKKYRNTICGRHPILVLLNVCIVLLMKYFCTNFSFNRRLIIFV